MTLKTHKKKKNILFNWKVNGKNRILKDAKMSGMQKTYYY